MRNLNVNNNCDYNTTTTVITGGGIITTDNHNNLNYLKNNISSLSSTTLTIGSNSMPVVLNDSKLNNNSSLNANNKYQSMTNEETRRLTGMVAKTRALFESKENLTKSNSQLFQNNELNSPSSHLSQVLVSSSKHNFNPNHHNYNNTDSLHTNTIPTTTTATTIQSKPTINEYIHKTTTPKQSFSATNLSSILKNGSSINNLATTTTNLNNYDKENNHKTSNINLNNTKKLNNNNNNNNNAHNLYSSDLYLARNKAISCMLNTKTFTSRFQDQQSNEIETNTDTTQPLTRNKLKKFNVNSSAKSSIELNDIDNNIDKSDNISLKSNSDNSNHKSTVSDHLSNSKLSVKEVKKCFESNFKINDIQNKIKTKQLLANKTYNNNTNTNVDSFNGNQSNDDNASTSSVSSVSSFSSYYSSSQSGIGSTNNIGYHHKFEKPPLASITSTSSATTSTATIIPTNKDNTRKNNVSCKLPTQTTTTMPTTVTPTPIPTETKTSIIPAPLTYSTSSSSSSSSSTCLSSSCETTPRYLANQNSHATITPQSASTTSSSVYVNNDATTANKIINPSLHLKHKIVKLDNVSHYAKEVIDEVKEESKSEITPTLPKSTMATETENMASQEKIQESAIQSPRYSTTSSNDLFKSTSKTAQNNISSNKNETKVENKITVTPSYNYTQSPLTSLINKLQKEEAISNISPSRTANKDYRLNGNTNSKTTTTATTTTTAPKSNNTNFRFQSAQESEETRKMLLSYYNSIHNPSTKDQTNNTNVDNHGCVLPSKIRNRSQSLVNPKQILIGKNLSTSQDYQQVNNAPKKVVRSASSAREALLRWCKKMTEDYNNVRIDNFSSSWANGLAFCALIHHFLPNEYDYSKLDSINRRYNFELAFKTAEDAGICSLLDVDDMILMGDSPDWKCVFTYVHSIYQRFKDASISKPV